MDNNSVDRPDLGGASPPLAMTRQQTEVFELLRGLSTKEQQFHEWYRGAIQIINSQSPDRIAQAAHSIRELCDGLPKCIGNIPEFKNPISAAKQFGPQFLNVKGQSYGKGWKGEIINQPLAEVLCRFETLFSEPPRAKRLGLALIAADPQGDALSKDWRKERDRTFEGLVGFFQNVAHHNHSAAEPEFSEKLEFFEALLLNYLTPCTAAQQKELLTLVTAPLTADTFARVSELISHKAANFSFFLEKLDNPNWLPHLDESGYFTNLPEPEPTEDGRILYRYHMPASSTSIMGISSEVSPTCRLRSRAW
jgi:hypothetical protein